jgi:hypothetical protein
VKWGLILMENVERLAAPQGARWGNRRQKMMRTVDMAGAEFCRMPCMLASAPDLQECRPESALESGKDTCDPPHNVGADCG